MRSMKWISAIVCIAVLISGMTGCKSSRRKAGDPMGADNIAGVTGSDIYGVPLGGEERMGIGREYAGQFTPVYFDYDSSQVNASERAKLEQVADYMRRNPRQGMIVEGHCDERGSSEYNLSLGERRALAARAYLVGLGIDGSRIQTKSYGEEKPAAMGHDESAYRMNRRAEFIAFE